MKKAYTILEEQSIEGNTIIAQKLTPFLEIDLYKALGDTLMAEFDTVTGKKFCFDLDGVIAHLSPNNDYNLSTPNQEMIERVNHLYENGNQITVFTARGGESGIDWYQISYDQLMAWGVKFHRFLTGKPSADYYVDDKNVLVSQFFKY